MAAMLELQDICKTFRIGPTEVQVLRGLSVSLEAGELCSIMGGSGSGKSTFMNIVGLLDKPTSGAYRINGEDVLSAHADALARLRNRLIGFVFQSYFLLPRLPAWRNVALPLMYRGTPLHEAREHAHDMLARVGLADRADYLPASLSGGQRQRVAIARALVGTPAIVLADEPTGALDPVIGQEIMDLFVKLNRELGIMILVITHDPDIAAQCRRQIVLRAGQFDA